MSCVTSSRRSAKAALTKGSLIALTIDTLVEMLSRVGKPVKLAVG